MNCTHASKVWTDILGQTASITLSKNEAKFPANRVFLKFSISTSSKTGVPWDFTGRVFFAGLSVFNPCNTDLINAQLPADLCPKYKFFLKSHKHRRARKCPTIPSSDILCSILRNIGHGQSEHGQFKMAVTSKWAENRTGTWMCLDVFFASLRFFFLFIWIKHDPPVAWHLSLTPEADLRICHPHGRKKKTQRHTNVLLGQTGWVPFTQGKGMETRILGGILSRHASPVTHSSLKRKRPS